MTGSIEGLLRKKGGSGRGLEEFSNHNMVNNSEEFVQVTISMASALLLRMQ